MGDDNERDAVAEARALLDKATPGEWLWDTYNEEVITHQRAVICSLGLWFQKDADGALIAAAPRLLRRLADECETLRAALAQRIATSGTPPVVDVTHYVPLDLDVLRNAASEPQRETGLTPVQRDALAHADSDDGYMLSRYHPPHRPLIDIYEQLAGMGLVRSDGYADHITYYLTDAGRNALRETGADGAQDETAS